MIPIHEITFPIRHSEVGRDGRLKWCAFADFLQEAAAQHAELLGVGPAYLRRNGRAWVLSRLKIEIDRYPAAGDRLLVRTWPRATEKLFFSRHFELTLADGAPVGRASSAWLLIDAARMRPLRPAVLEGLLPDNSALAAFFPELYENPGKSDRADTPFLFGTAVRYSDTDINGHLNNARYFAFVQDFLDCSHPVRFQLHFLSESRPGAVLNIHGGRSGDDFHVEGRAPDGGVHFRSSGTFRRPPEKN